MGRGIDRQALVKALLETSTELGIRRRELADERKAHAETRALLNEHRDGAAADAERALEAEAERDTVRHVLGCVELALAGREPSDDWPALAHAVAALRAGKVEKREPKGKWDRYGGLKSATHGRLVAEVGLAGWGVCTDDDSIWRARGPETGTAGKLAAEAWLDAQGVEYERAKVEVEAAWREGHKSWRLLDDDGGLRGVAAADGWWSVTSGASFGWDAIGTCESADEAKAAAVRWLDEHGIKYETRPKGGA